MAQSYASQFSVEALNQFYGSAFLGVKFVKVSDATVRAELKVDQRHLRPGGIVNGGIYLILIETLGSISACCNVDMAKFNPLGIQVSANHVGIAREGDTLVAESAAVHIGRSTQIWDVKIGNQNGKALSSGRITIMIVPNRA